MLNWTQEPMLMIIKPLSTSKNMPEPTPSGYRERRSGQHKHPMLAYMSRRSQNHLERTRIGSGNTVLFLYP